MSADNFILTVEAPKRDGTGKEWLVADVRLSSFDCDAWNKHDRDSITLELAYYMKGYSFMGLYDSLEAAEAVATAFEGIVEYDPSTYVINFPFPTEEEITDTKVRWEADKPRREHQEKIDFIQLRIGILEEEIVRFPIFTQRLRDEIVRYERNPKKNVRKMATHIRENELSKRQVTFERKQEELVQLRVGLETAQAELVQIMSALPTP